MKNLFWFSVAVTALMLCLSRGQFVMLGGVVGLIIAHEFGHWLVARLLGFEVQTFSIGFGSSPRLLLGKFRGTEFQLTPWLLGGYVSIDPSDANFQEKPIWRRASVMAAGVAMNLLLSLLITFFLFASCGQRELVYRDVSVYQLSTQTTVAAKAGIKLGDRLVAIDGSTVLSPQSLTDQLSTHHGTPAKVTVQRRGTNIDYFVTPDESGHIGVIMGGTTEASYRHLSLTSAAFEAVKYNVGATVSMLKGLALVMHIMPLQEGMPPSSADVHGIVAIVQIGARAYEGGVYSFFAMLSMISLNLAIVNILPIPILDGGHLLFLAWEKLTGKAVVKQTQEIVNSFFVVALFGVMLLGLFNDFAKPIVHQ